VRWGSSGAEGCCHDNQFWDTFCITGFVGYNFGCIIASDALFDPMGGFSGSSYPLRHRRDRRVSKGHCHGNQFGD